MRKRIITAKRIVVKVGTRTLTTQAGSLSEAKIKKIVASIVGLVRAGKEVILVSSGAIACGMGVLGLKKRPRDLAILQAAAAIGQGKLVHIYEKYFSKMGVHSGQILLTIDGMYHRARYLNARNTVNSLLHLGIIPIVNENDTVATEEIRFGDNDNLSAQVAIMAHADLLILLSNVKGFITREGKHKKVLPLIEDINHSLRMHLYEKNDEKTVGGMESKLEAAFTLMKLGVPTIIADGEKKNILKKLMKGEEEGTLFYPRNERKLSRKSWLAFTAAHSLAGSVLVDEGAYVALSKKGKSLLASGIKDVKGVFKFGDAVKIVTVKGVEFAKGITNYSHEELKKIKGKKTGEIKEILGYKTYDEVIHRDNMVVIE